MAVTVYRKMSLTGGLAGDLDSVDGALLLDGDVAFVTESGVVYTYVLDDNLGGAEASPRIIAPDVNPGNLRWVLQQVNADGAVLKGGTNTFNVTNGTASLDVAAACAVNVDHNLTTGGACTVGGNAVNPTLPAFLAFNSANDVNVTGDGTAFTIIVDSEVFDQNANFASNTFTAPVTGKYSLIAQIQLSDLAAGHVECDLSIVTSNRTYFNRIDRIPSQPNYSMGLSCLADMDAGDTAYVTIAVFGSTKVVDVLGHSSIILTYFSGHLVC